MKRERENQTVSDKAREVSDSILNTESLQSIIASILPVLGRLEPSDLGFVVSVSPISLLVDMMVETEDPVYSRSLLFLLSHFSASSVFESSISVFEDESKVEYLLLNFVSSDRRQREFCKRLISNCCCFSRFICLRMLSSGLLFASYGLRDDETPSVVGSVFSVIKDEFIDYKEEVESLLLHGLGTLRNRLVFNCLKCMERLSESEVPGFDVSFASDRLPVLALNDDIGISVLSLNVLRFLNRVNAGIARFLVDLISSSRSIQIIIPIFQIFIDRFEVFRGMVDDEIVGYSLSIKGSYSYNVWRLAVHVVCLYSRPEDFDLEVGRALLELSDDNDIGHMCMSKVLEASHIMESDGEILFEELQEAAETICNTQNVSEKVMEMAHTILEI